MTLTQRTRKHAEIELDRWIRRQRGRRVKSAGMIPAGLLEQLRNAVEVDDWILAADVCLEINLAAQDELDRERADDLAKGVRLQDAELVEAIIEELEA